MPMSPGCWRLCRVHDAYGSMHASQSYWVVALLEASFAQIHSDQATGSSSQQPEQTAAQHLQPFMNTTRSCQLTGVMSSVVAVEAIALVT